MSLTLIISKNVKCPLLSASPTRWSIRDGYTEAWLRLLEQHGHDVPNPGKLHIITKQVANTTLF